MTCSYSKLRTDAVVEGLEPAFPGHETKSIGLIIGSYLACLPAVVVAWEDRGCEVSFEDKCACYGSIHVPMRVFTFAGNRERDQVGFSISGKPKPDLVHFRYKCSLNGIARAYPRRIDMTTFDQPKEIEVGLWHREDTDGLGLRIYRRMCVNLWFQGDKSVYIRIRDAIMRHRSYTSDD
jgi:hypothetical protein